MSRIFTISLSLLFLIHISGVSQTTVTLNALKDNTIYQDFPGNSNAIGGDITAGNSSGLAPRRGLIKFDIAASVPAGSVITSVTLKLNCNKTRAGADNVKLFKLLADWGEGTSNAGSGASGDGRGVPATVNDATWPCRNADGAGGCGISWTSQGGDFNATASATTSVGGALSDYTWSSAQMVADVQSWRNTPANNFGWLIMGDESTFTTAKRFGSRENSTVAQRPSLSVTYNSPVPVTLMNFSGNETKLGITLTWQTAAEYNNAFFEIEHSTDGSTFTTIGKVTGAGTSTLLHSYQFTHQGITAGQHFYRLAQVDINGYIHYSNVLSFTAKSSHLQLTITPNPVNNILNIGFAGNRTGESYLILSAAGIQVKSGKLSGNQLAIDGLPGGFYMLRLFNPDGTVLSGLFLKQ